MTSHTKETATRLENLALATVFTITVAMAVFGVSIGLIA